LALFCGTERVTIYRPTPPTGGFLCVTSVGQDLGVLGHDVRLSIEYTLAHGHKFALDYEQ